LELKRCTLMRGIRWWVLLVAGPLGLLAAVVAPPLGIFEEPLRHLGVAPEALPMMEQTVQRVLGLLWWMLCWWLGEVVPLAVTALLPAAVAPLLRLLRWESTGGAQPIAATELLRAYADPIVLLFLGSFLLAQALQRYELDRRWALWMLSRAGWRARTHGCCWCSWLRS
jgi:sodium-dependent dicarboxylate transporter 2/3/5